MPTRKHRVTVTLEPRTAEVVKRMAELQGRSQASVISELIEEVAEPMERTLALVEAAAAAPKQVRDGLRASAEQIEDQLRKSVQAFGHESDDLLEFLERASNASDERASRSADDDARKASGSARRRPARSAKKRAKKKGQPPGSNHGGQVSSKGGS